MATQTTGGGSTTSLNNTVQATGDTFYETEDFNSIAYLDVMLNDLGGNAKILWSVDDTATDGSADLISSDIGEIESTTSDTSLNGAKIWICNGKVAYDASTLSASFKAALQALAVGQTLTDSFTYAIRLSNGTLSWATATVVYTGQNDAPVAHADSNGTDTVIESGVNPGNTPYAGDPSASGNVLTNDTDPDSGALLTVANVNGSAANVGASVQGTYGSVMIGSNGAWTYTLDNSDPDTRHLAQGQSVTEIFNYTVTDEYGATSTSTLTITITGTNDAPSLTAIASGTYVDTDGDNSFSDLTGTLTSTDPDTGATATYGVTGGSASVEPGFDVELSNAYGTLYVNSSTGAYQFVPDDSAIEALDSGDTDSVSFTLTVTDEWGASDSKTLTINLTGADDAPTLAAVTSGSIAEVDQSSSTNSSGLSGTLNGSDVDGDSLTYGISGGAADNSHAGYDRSLAGSYGTLYVNSSTGAYLYVPDPAAVEALDDGDTPSDSFTLTVNDGDGPDVTQSYVINLTGADDAPASSNGSGSTNEDTPLSSSLPAATDVDGDSITYALGTQATNGTAVVNADGTFTYTPNANYSGSDSFTFTISDGDDGVVTYTYNVTVNAVNDAPVNTLPASYSTNEDTAKQLTGLSVADVDAASGAIKVTLSVDSGTLAATSGGGVTVVGSGTGSFELTGTLSAINAYLGGASAPTFTPAANANGDVTLTMTTTDNGFTGSGGAQTDTDTSTIHVAAVNDAAVITGDTSGSVTEDAVPNTVGGNLNSTDVDNANDSWTASSGGSANGYGSFTIDASGNWVYTLDNTNPTVNALNNGGTLSDSFTVTTIDGTSQVVSITINGHTDGIVIPPVYTGDDDPNNFDTKNDQAAGTGLITGTTGDDVPITGSGGADTIRALDGNDTVNAGNGGDTVYGGTGVDTINGGLGNDTLYGQAGNDIIHGDDGNDTVYGGSGDDQIFGDANNDQTLFGGSGSDTISGGDNNDVLAGGFGADSLSGGGGNDRFVYLDLRDTGDTITDWNTGDTIDLSAIDANSVLAGDQGPFAFGGTTATAFGVWYSVSGGNATVYVDTDGDTSTAELAITLLGVTTLGSGDFTL